MKILVANGIHNVGSSVCEKAHVFSQNVHVTVVDEVDEFLLKLTTESYDYIVTECYAFGLDIWQFSKLVNSNQYSAHAAPIYLITEACTLAVPPALAKAHSIHLVGIEDLINLLNADHKIYSMPGSSNRFTDKIQSNILVIEDHKDTAEIIRLGLANDYKVDVEYTGQAGCQLWIEKRHDLILLDYLLPDINGSEVLSRITAVSSAQPVIVMTGLDYEWMGQEMIMLGASDHIYKPVDINLLKKRIEAHIEVAKVDIQAHYWDKKIEMVSTIIWVIDHALEMKDYQYVSKLIKVLKGILTPVLSEDDQERLEEIDQETLVDMWPEIAQVIKSTGY